MLNPSKLLSELVTAGLPAVGVSSDGKLDYSQPLTPAQQTTADQIILDHDPLEYQLSPDTVFIKSNGVHAAVVLYAVVSQDPDFVPPTTLTLIINGSPQVFDLDAYGMGQTEITSDTPGAIIEISMDDDTAQQCTIYSL
jgi:hypothetical protein